MKKVSKFIAIIFSLVTIPLLGQHVDKITIDQQVSFTQLSVVGNPSLLVESIVVEITMIDIARLNQANTTALFNEHNNNKRTNSPISSPEKNVTIPLFKGELFPLKQHSYLEKQLSGTIPTLLRVENTPKQASVVPTNLKLPTTYQNRPKALGSLLKF